MVHSRSYCAAALVLGGAMLAACSAQNARMTAAPPMPARMPLTASATSVLSTLTREQTIGSTSPQTPHDVNPYGLDVAKATAGNITAGDLVVCDFNNPGNVQGTGTEIVALHPTVGSSPVLIAKDNTLMGCNALATAPNGNIWLAAFKANDNPIFTPSDSSMAEKKREMRSSFRSSSDAMQCSMTIMAWSS